MNSYEKRATWRLRLLLGFVAIAMARLCPLQAQELTSAVQQTPSDTSLTTSNALSTATHDDNAATLALKTNILTAAFLVPAVGIEVPVARRWSVAADWMYGWWSHNRSHDYWRIYGGSIEARYWLTAARGGGARRTLAGHHFGAYLQTVTFDFEFGDRGYMGGKPHGSLWDKAVYGGGLSYGYAWRVTRRINFDATIGLGYLDGDVQQYHPDKGCYVYERTKRLHYFGPTRAEVQLVWLLGHGRKGKGARR